MQSEPCSLAQDGVHQSLKAGNQDAMDLKHLVTKGKLKVSELAKCPSLNTKLKTLNPTIKKHKKMNFFQTLNNAKVIWDPRSKPKGILIGHINICSIGPKKEQIDHLLGESNIDIFGITETWLCSTTSAAVVNVPEYNVYRRDRGTDRYGGILVYVKNHLKCEVITWPEEVNLECIGLNVILSPTMSFIVICMYLPQLVKNEVYDQLEIILKNCNPKKEIILMGDLNINWNNKSERGKLKQIMDKHYLTQIINGPTRVTKKFQTMIDLIFTNKPDRIVKTFNLLAGLSDHNFILCSRKINRQHPITNKSRSYEFIPKLAQQHLRNELEQFRWLNVLNCEDIESCSNNFIKSVNEMVTRFTKKAKLRKSKDNVPWLNSDCRKLMKERDRALKKYLKTKISSDRQIFTVLRNKVIKHMRKAKANYYFEIIKRANGNGKVIWKNINTLLGRKNEDQFRNLQLQVNGTLTDDLSKVVNMFNSYFISSIEELTKLQRNGPDIPHNPIDINKPIFVIKEITPREVISTIQSLKSSKAKDTFGLTSHFLKLHQEALARPIAHIINQSNRG